MFVFCEIKKCIGRILSAACSVNTFPILLRASSFKPIKFTKNVVFKEKLKLKETGHMMFLANTSFGDL